ncbi:appr-1-p processing protein [Striga asiatica]|uniref:Appr-1-p processing protein n=1 Tax=Striga asiatica TaxID=4170 RepID=A0A5A7QQ51_STRAF|nr:appr-1-p processing protein [Striga asiatica]
MKIPRLGGQSPTAIKRMKPALQKWSLAICLIRYLSASWIYTGSHIDYADFRMLLRHLVAPIVACLYGMIPPQSAEYALVKFVMDPQSDTHLSESGELGGLSEVCNGSVSGRIEAFNCLAGDMDENRLLISSFLCDSYVIHTFGPIYNVEENPQASLKNAYRYLYDEVAAYALSIIKEFAGGFEKKRDLTDENDTKREENFLIMEKSRTKKENERKQLDRRKSSGGCMKR